MQIAIAEAKSQFADLVRRAEAGEEIELTRYGRPVARLTASASRGNRLIGCARGQFVAPAHADDDSDDAVAALLTRGPIQPE